MLSRTICTTSLMVALCGCAHAPQSYTFTASGSRDGAINAVAATLKKQGIEPGLIDYRAGTITSRWFDTGYRFREIDNNRPLNFYTDIFLRHHISVSESSGARPRPVLQSGSGMRNLRSWQGSNAVDWKGLPGAFHSRFAVIDDGETFRQLEQTRVGSARPTSVSVKTCFPTLGLTASE